MSCVNVRLVTPTWPEEVTVHFSQGVTPLLSQVGGVDTALKVTDPRPRLGGLDAGRLQRQRQLDETQRAGLGRHRQARVDLREVRVAIPHAEAADIARQRLRGGRRRQRAGISQVEIAGTTLNSDSDVV